MRMLCEVVFFFFFLCDCVCLIVCVCVCVVIMIIFFISIPLCERSNASKLGWQIQISIRVWTLLWLAVGMCVTFTVLLSHDWSLPSVSSESSCSHNHCEMYSLTYERIFAFKCCVCLRCITYTCLSEKVVKEKKPSEKSQLGVKIKGFGDFYKLLLISASC